MSNIILTTTNTIEGRKVVDYKGVIFGEVVNGVDFVKDFAAGITNFLGGRSGSYENELIDARMNALDELKKRAESLGANAVIGIKVDYETLGQGNMLMVTASGTAVVVE